jgi:hypothetical protein
MWSRGASRKQLTRAHRRFFIVMAGLVPAIHVLQAA